MPDAYYVLYTVLDSGDTSFININKVPVLIGLSLWTDNKLNTNSALTSTIHNISSMYLRIGLYEGKYKEKARVGSM